MQPFISKMLIDIRLAAQFNTPTWTTFFLERGILKPCYVGPLQNYIPKSLSKLMPRVLVLSAHLHAAQMLPATLVLLQPTTLCGRIKDLHAWLASSSTHIHASAEQHLCYVVPPNCFQQHQSMLGRDLCLISNSPILDSRTFYNLHHSWTTLLSSAPERLLPKELFLSLIRVASITRDCSWTAAHLHISSSRITQATHLCRVFSWSTVRVLLSCMPTKVRIQPRVLHVFHHLGS